MAICTKINTAGTTLQNNLNARGVSCTYGKNSESKQTIKDMADLITSSNLKGSADSLISITANRPYLLEDETTDLTVRLVNGLGQPLANKSVSISDGSSLYSGITNTNGLFTLFDVEVESNTTYTATYSNSSANCIVYFCQFVDYGVSNNHNDNWETPTTNIQVIRGSEYTTVSETSTTSAQYRANNNVPFTGDFTIEWDNYFTPNNYNYFIISGTSDSAFRMDSQAITDGCHVKLEITNLTMKIYIDGNLKYIRSINNRDGSNGLKFRFQLNDNANNLKYSNFVIY